jgi:DNA-cytosine methyltransferase
MVRHVDMFCGIGGFGLAALRLGAETVWANDICPAAAEVYGANLSPAVLGDARAVAASIPPHDILTAGLPCFAKGTLVLARVGYTPIEDIVVGDEVLTHLGRWRRVTAVMSRRDAPLRRVRGQGVVVTATDEHPFWARIRTIEHPHHTTLRSFGDPRWVAASELIKDHFLAQIIPEVKPDGRTIEFWWLVGRYLADGWRMRKKDRPDAGRTVICCAPAEADELRTRIAAAGFHATHAVKRTTVTFNICVNSLYRFLEPFGKYAHGKTLPSFALSLSRAKSTAILDGYMSGDGFAGPGFRRATTVSKRLAFSIALLAQRIGVVASIRQYIPKSNTTVIEGRIVHQRPMWFIDIPNRNRSGFVEGRYGWKKVKKSERCGRGAVYNLSVDEDESYMADGAISHNCQPFSSAGRRGGSSDDRGTLFRAVAGALESLRPVAFVVENVPNLPRVRGGRDFAAMLDAFAAAGYLCSHAVVNAADFGLAQNRTRLFVAGRLAAPPLFLPPPPTQRATVADILEPDPGERYDMHEATLARLPACARVDRLVGGVRVLWNQRGGSRMGYTVFGTDGLAPTLTASGSRHYERYLVGGRFRRLTPVEYARLQGFPDQWCGAAPHAMRYRLLGNAVPPPMAEWAMRAALGP